MQKKSTAVVIGCSWTKGMQAGRSDPEGTAKALADSAASQGYTADDFTIYAITGSEDIAEPCMTPMFELMKGHSDVFRMSENANTYYFVKDGGVHNMTYFYMRVPDGFDSKSNTFLEDGTPEYLEWVSLDTDKVIYPEFFKTELKYPVRETRHIVADER